MRTRDYRRRQSKRIKNKRKSIVKLWGRDWQYLVNDPKYIGRWANTACPFSEHPYMRVPLWLRRAPKIEDN